MAAEDSQLDEQKKPTGLQRDPVTGLITWGVAQDTNKNGTAGRPTKYKRKFAKELVAFFDLQPFAEVDVQTTDKRSGKVYISKELRGIEFPTLELFAHRIGVTYGTLKSWAHEKYPDDYKDVYLRGKLMHPEFSVAWERAQQLQKHILSTNALMGLYNGSFAQFVGKNFLGMHDKQEIDHTTKGKSMQPQVVSQIEPRAKQDASTQTQAAPSNPTDQQPTD